MIQIMLSGGLGNQLFIYAFYRYIEQKYGELPYLDDRYYAWSKNNRCSELSIIFPNYPVHRFFFNPAGHRKILRNLFSWKQRIWPDYLVISEDNYNDDIIYTGDIYFSGFWQSAKYVETLPKSLFEPQEKLPEELVAIEKQIRASKYPISLHVRRGDFFVPSCIDRYGVCTPDYYHRAIDQMEQLSNDDNTYFIFSDDLEFVKKHVSLGENSILVPNYPVNSFWYIYLMSLCKHNIISNSTFSWWGAYLNSHDEKIVIGPSRWMLDSDFDLMMPNWIKVPVDNHIKP